MPKPASEEVKAQWENHIREQRQSGLSIVAWCSQNCIAPYKFYYWRDKIFAKSQLDRSTFTEIPDHKSCQNGITLEFQGVRILLDRHFDQFTLKRCLEVLKEC